MKFFKELTNYDTKDFTSPKTRLYQEYILKVESYLNLPQYHKYLYMNDQEDASYNELQEYISYQDCLLLQHILKNQSMEFLFSAIDISDDLGTALQLQETIYESMMENDSFSEFQDKQLLNVKVMNGDSFAQTLADVENLLITAIENQYYNRDYFPSMVIMIRENEDLLYKIRFLRKIGYPVNESRLRRMLDGKFFMNIYKRSDVLINDNLYHMSILTLNSKINLWKWITLKQEHDYIEQCYMDALSGNWKRKERKDEI